MTTIRGSIAIAATLLSGAAAVNNGLAVTPPMGWV
jgi:alpha-galactosidase